MHILLGIIGAVAALGYYIFIFRRAGDAVNEVVDVAGKIRGKVKRNAFRKKVEGSTLTAIDDPGTAGLLMLAKIAEHGGRISVEAKGELLKIANNIIGAEDAEEAVSFVEWIVPQVAEPKDIVRRFKDIWLAQLNQSQLKEFVSLADEISKLEGPQTVEQRDVVGYLAMRLGLSH